MEKFLLMYEDYKLALFSVPPDGDIVDELILNQEFLKYLPVGIHTQVQLKKWIAHRGIPVTRDHIAEDLSGFGMTPFRLMLAENGLSLTDHYWICRQDEHFLWRDINLYTNPFRSAYSLDLQDDLLSIASRTNFVPSASLQGDLKKKWIIDQDGVRRLVKGNSGSSCRQSLCEVLASEIHRRQGIPHTPYRLIQISSGGNLITGCECPGFADISTEFVSTIDIMANEKKPNDISWYEFYLAVCGQYGLDLRNFMEYQILSDFVISNTDRHLNNFGILRDTHSLKWLGPAPIFDSGNAMFTRAESIPSGRELLKIQVTSFCNTEVKLLKYVKNRMALDPAKLPDDNYLYNLLQKDTTVNEEVNDRLVKAYNSKIKYLQDFQDGANLWEHSYAPPYR